MFKPDAYLLELSPPEKQMLHDRLKKKKSRLYLIYLPLLTGSVAGIFYLNNHMVMELPESRLTMLNIALVIIATLSVKLLLSNTLIINKEMSGFQKKVVRGTIIKKEKGSIFIGSHEIEPGKKVYDLLNVGDKVEIYLSLKTEILLGYKKI